MSLLSLVIILIIKVLEKLFQVLKMTKKKLLQNQKSDQNKINISNILMIKKKMIYKDQKHLNKKKEIQ